ncbi:acyl-CoA synthetase [Shewanella sp. Scap07]|uniref:AMP-binding protein n=1 Tax=Shewanella sp. Scap07 TaxID=2589987 RepID=UPI0015B7ECEF|nr:AMP-binding protein [Shewanella sp. Scap07]QLE87285.1 acyl-CoA synthetase [Shewanella sp. Scap07]
MTELLTSWLIRGPSSQQLISFNHHDIVTGALFTNQVAHIHTQLSQSQARRWLLASDDSALFAAGLCAALLAGKQIVLPNNTQSGTLSAMTHQFDGVLSDQPLCEGKRLILLKKDYPNNGQPWPALSQWGELQLYTSGSSGEPKAIIKQLAQLDAEVSMLAQTFSKQVAQSSVIATVSHQHIYGLLFKILWPLAAGYPFLSELVEYPETLTYYTNLFPNLCLVSSPAQLSRLPDALDNEVQLRSPGVIFSSGGPLSFEAASKVAHCYGKLPIEIYGSTETGGIGYRQQQQSEQAWQCFGSHQIKRDETDGALWLQSPYLGHDDWLKCDDKIALLSAQQFVLQGRLDRVVKIEEKRVSLEQMEALLRSHPLVDDAALVMLSQPRAGLGGVIILSQQGQQQLQAQGKLALNNSLKAQLLTQFERVTLPKRWRYPDVLPLNTQGKRIHTELVELFNHD